MMMRRRTTTTRTEDDKDYCSDEVTMMMMRRRTMRTIKWACVWFLSDTLFFIATPNIHTDSDIIPTSSQMVVPLSSMYKVIYIFSNMTPSYYRTINSITH